MQAKLTPISGLLVMQRTKFEDKRGSFERIFCSDTLALSGEFKDLSQANYSKTSTAGSVRGMHLQRAPECEKKLVTCVQGRILDVAVDMRQGSPTFLEHFSIELNSQESKSLLIPEGVAHGFQSLTDNVDLIYFHSRNYSPEYEFGFNPLDPLLNIEWPIKISNMSEKDANHKFITHEFSGLNV